MNLNDVLACRHEAIHVVAADHFGWPIRGVVRRPDASGMSDVIPRTDGDLRERLDELGVILFAPALDGCGGTSGDLASLDKLLAVGARLSRILPRTGELLADTEFRRRVRVVESALFSRPAMSGDEVALLLEDHERDDRRMADLRGAV